MKILALDSSGLVASVALLENDNLVAEFTVNNKKTHSQTLLPMLDEVVNAAGIELDAVEKPLIHIPTLEGLAYNLYDPPGLICPIMDARRNQVYTGLYRFDEAGNLVTEMDQIPMDVNELIDLLLEKDEEVQFTGDGIQVYGSQILSKMKHARLAPAHLNKQRAGAVGALAEKYYREGKTVTAAEHQPEYLRVSQAERERAEREAGKK